MFFFVIFLFNFKFFLKESKKIAKVNRECDDIYRNVQFVTFLTKEVAARLFIASSGRKAGVLSLEP